MSEEGGQKLPTVEDLERAYRLIMNYSVQPEKITFPKDYFIKMYAYIANITIEKARGMVELEIYKRTKLGITDMFKNIIFIVSAESTKHIKEEDEEFLSWLGLNK